jgi:hypothetical protein
MHNRTEIKNGFELGGQSPDPLTIAEYLQVLGDGSSRPAPPSDSAPEADASVNPGCTAGVYQSNRVAADKRHD